eukprot:1157249-Pelagomonas_calceolata.AAC.5
MIAFIAFECMQISSAVVPTANHCFQPLHAHRKGLLRCPQQSLPSSLACLWNGSAEVPTATIAVICCVRTEWLC